MNDDLDIRGIESVDLNRVLELNQAELPAVSHLDSAALRDLVEMSTLALVAGTRSNGDGAQIAGFALVLGPGADYESENYTWFSQRYADFVYLDRVVVAPDHRRRKVGRRLYAEVEARAAAQVLCLEVNTEPRNDVSLSFHDRLGFVPVGDQYTQGGAKRVVMLAKPIGTGEPTARPAETTE